MENDPETLRHQAYLEHRRVLTDIESQQQRSFDKAILSVSSGALGLSLLFSEKIAAIPVHSCWLYAAWIALCLAIVSTTVSFLLSVEATSKQRDLFDRWYLHGAEGEEPSSQLTAWVGGLNWTSLVFACVGVLFLTWFAVVNFEQRSKTGNGQVSATSATEAGKRSEAAASADQP